MEPSRPLTRQEGEPPARQLRGHDELQLKLEAARTAAAERAVADERQRIARELHDVVAHSVSVMTVQAGAVRRLLHPDQERERLALETIEATGREALTEMRRLVGLLRDESATPDFAPQPSMRAIDVLLGTVRESGLPVDLAAYRVIQEALTNALKYAGPARACVTVRWKRSELELEVANDGTSEPGGDGGGGHGLVGLRERVSLVGGSIESGPREGGGFVVKAHLPLGERT
jgi:signal transduction histidine kinase